MSNVHRSISCIGPQKGYFSVLRHKDSGRDGWTHCKDILIVSRNPEIFDRDISIYYISQ